MAGRGFFAGLNVKASKPTLRLSALTFAAGAAQGAAVAQATNSAGASGGTWSLTGFGGVLQISSSGAITATSTASAAQAYRGSLTYTYPDGTAVTFPPVTLTAVGPSVGLTMVQLAANRVYQRTSSTGGLLGKGQASVAVAMSLAAAANLIEYRLRDASTGVTVQDWTTAATSPAASLTSINCPVPARLGWNFLDLRANQDPGQVVLGTAPIGVGRVVAVAGQSLAVRMLGKVDTQAATIASLGVPISPYGAVYASYANGVGQALFNAGAWGLPADGYASQGSYYGSAFLAEFLRLEVAAAGVNCGVIGHAVGGTGISSWEPGSSTAQTACYGQLATTLAAAGGAWEAMIWMQGHSDSGGGTTNANYQSALTTAFAGFAALNSQPSFAKYLASIPNIDSSAWGTPAAIMTIRQAAAAWCAANSATYVQPEDLDLIDGVHETMAGAVTLARHFYRATRPELGLASNDNGPIITGATRAANSLDIVLPVSLASGATLASVGAPGSRFKVFPTGATSGALALNSAAPITVGPNTITLHLAADPGNATPLDVYAFYPPDPSYTGEADCIYDTNASDGDGLTTGRQLAATILTPITAAAPVPSVPVNTAAPAITGSSAAIGLLTAGTGSWNYGPTSYAYQWYRGGSAISGATGSTYATSDQDSGQTITVAVTASNNVGASSPATSAGLTMSTSGYSLTMTSPVYDTTGEKEGSAALSGGYGVTPSETYWPSALTTGITLEAWIKPSTTLPSHAKVALGAGGSFGPALIGMQTNGHAYCGGGASPALYLNGTTNMADGNWHHLEIDMGPSGYYLFVDGALQASATTGLPTGFPTASGVFAVGDFGGAQGGVWTWAGEVDEAAIWSGVRHTSNFTPPAAPYVGNEPGLVGLFHLDSSGARGF